MPEWSLRFFRGKWCAYAFVGGKSVRRSLRTADRQIAEKRFASVLADIRTADAGAPDTIDALVALYLKSLPDASSARRRGGFVLASIKRAVGSTLLSTPPGKLDRETCEAYADARYRQGISAGSVISELGLVKTALNWAVRERIMERAPHVHRPAAPPPRDRWLSADEARRLLDACDTPHLRLFVLLALHTAGRAGAILGLTWDRVNDRFIDLRAENPAHKSKKRAVVPLHPALKETLCIAKKTAVAATVVEYGGKPVASIKKSFAKAAERAGLEGVTPHVLRHTAATWMAQAGVDMRKISLYLGHSSVAITERIYAKHSPGYLKDGADAVAEAMGSGLVVQLNKSGRI